MGAFACVWALASGVGPPIVSQLELCTSARGFPSSNSPFGIRVVHCQPSRIHGGDGSDPVDTLYVHYVGLSDSSRLQCRLQPPGHWHHLFARAQALLPPCFHTFRFRVDSGNTITITGTAIALISLTWDGVAHKWTDPHTLATLIVGFILKGVLFVYKWLASKEPSIPWEVVTNRTSLSACRVLAADAVLLLRCQSDVPSRYVGTFLHGPVPVAALFC